MRDETFGPVIGVQRVRDDAEALACLDDTEFGLGAAVFTRDRERAERILGQARRRQRVLEPLRPFERAAAVGGPAPLRPGRVDVGVGRAAPSSARRPGTSARSGEPSAA